MEIASDGLNLGLGLKDFLKLYPFLVSFPQVNNNNNN